MFGERGKGIGAVLRRRASTDRATTLFPGRGEVAVGAEQCFGKRVVSRSVLFGFGGVGQALGVRKLE